MSTSVRSPVVVHYAVEGDPQAARLETLLEAVGYVPVRVLASYGQCRGVEWAAAALAHKHGLTRRECELLVMIADGKTGAEVAAEWDVARATVKWHKHNLLVKLGGKRDSDLVRAVLRSFT